MINAIEAKKLALVSIGNQAEARRTAERQRQDENVRHVIARVDGLMPLIEAKILAASKKGHTQVHLRADKIDSRGINLDHTHEIKRRLKPFGYRVWHDMGGGVVDITVIDWKETSDNCGPCNSDGQSLSRLSVYAYRAALIEKLESLVKEGDDGPTKAEG